MLEKLLSLFKNQYEMNFVDEEEFEGLEEVDESDEYIEDPGVIGKFKYH